MDLSISRLDGQTNLNPGVKPNRNLLRMNIVQ